MSALAEFEFWVPGKPVPKGRPRMSRGRVFTPAATLEYEEKVREAAKAMVPEGFPTHLEYIVKVDLFFSDLTHGDIDNHAKTMDGINPEVKREKKKVVWSETPYVWLDDKQIRRMEIERFYVDSDDKAGMNVKIMAVPLVPRPNKKRKIWTKKPK